MDDSFLELENELKALSPRNPSVLLRAKIERDLGADNAASRAPAARVRYTSATTLSSWKWAGWRVAAAAALALTVFVGVWRWQGGGKVSPENPAPVAVVDGSRLIEPGGNSIASAPNVYRPVKASNVLYDLKDEGPVSTDDTAARRVRARYVDTYTFRNPATNASLKWSVPRDEVRIMPASFH